VTVEETLLMHVGNTGNYFYYEVELIKQRTYIGDNPVNQTDE